MDYKETTFLKENPILVPSKNFSIDLTLLLVLKMAIVRKTAQNRTIMMVLVQFFLMQQEQMLFLK